MTRRAYEALALVERLLKRGAGYRTGDTIEHSGDADCHVSQSAPDALVVTDVEGTQIHVKVGPVIAGTEGWTERRKHERRKRGHAQERTDGTLEREAPAER